jgi:hypothetical protein
MNANNEKPRWFFYTLWIILTSLCVPVAFFIDLAILKIIIRFVGDFIYVMGCVTLLKIIWGYTHLF